MDLEVIILSKRSQRKRNFVYFTYMGNLKHKDIKKRCQEYTEELYKKDLQHPDNHDGVITHLESDIPECDAR